jgi:hypothetical protein
MNCGIRIFVFVGIVYLVNGGEHSRRLMGGWYPQQTHNKNIQDISNYAAGTINDQSTSFLHKKMIHVHEAESQVVAGTKYRLVFDMASTVCRKNEAPQANASLCELHKEMPIERCNAVVYERVWLNERQVLDFNCGNHMSYADYFSGDNVSKDNAFHVDHTEKTNSL